MTMTRRRTLFAALPALALVATACGSPGADDRSAPAATSKTKHRVTVSVPAGRGGAPFDTKRTVVVPRGWTMSVWARLDAPRLAVWTPDRRLLVSRPGHGDVQVLTPRKGKAPAARTLLSGLRQPHGLAFRGNTLYVAESNRIDTVAYAKGKATGKRQLIGGLPDAKSPELGGQYAHALKSVAVAANGTVYLSIGSTGNISAQDRSASPQRATIMRWSPTTKKLQVYARGVRNGTGLALDPKGAVWTAVNNRDQIEYPYHRDYDGDGSDDYGKVITSYVNDHPMEALAKLRSGRDLGWPYCQPQPDVSAGRKGTKFDLGDRPFIRDAETNPTGSKLDCAKLRRLERGFPAHSAPLGLAFATLPKPFGTGALVATHGSWNRTPPRAPTVTFLHWSKGKLGGRQILVSGFQNGDGSRWGRPVAAVRGPDGAVYITDDQAGAVYRLARS
ncbi:Glucose/arabinose dehydrogenase, beta-propeller fold [Jatrophihabitans endophyticus]|uniref:Glucose/arabinose dehydrogenase, beta-propeller fold n=1 Tax=Jatrophihabitans endophyticus TaxID=1206085 RepID=A0A1M5UN33_9ACTN|nr:gluconolaconase [Jatrophihabitans endophyticus]SHH64133.1 Glucose/arabinose dehydrogenase, beta-propeller fold [Jatrophihabitans endophyticus]